MLTLESAIHAFRDAHIRMTPQRLLVIEALVGNHTHPTVEQLYDRVCTNCPTVALATVYQTVALLARHGLILELHSGPEGLRCDPDTSPHAHAYCEQCGQVFDIPLTEPVTLSKVDLQGFHAKQTELSFYGRCPDCQSWV
jgi:Fur family transcriptional regulator, peroxide stress response regulator